MLDLRAITDDELRWEVFRAAFDGPQVRYEIALEEWERRTVAQKRDWTLPTERAYIMASTEKKPGTGFLYPKKDRQGNQPNVTGELVLLDGVVVELAGWTKTSAKGTKYISLKASEPFVPDGEKPSETEQAATEQEAASEDIPF